MGIGIAPIKIQPDLYQTPPLDNFGFPNAELDTNKLTNLANKFGICNNISKDDVKILVDFFSDVDNKEYLSKTFLVDFSKQYPSIENYQYDMRGNKTVKNECYYNSIYEFYKKAKNYKFLKRYPILENSVNSCSKLKSALVVLAEEKANETTLHGLDSFEVKVVIDKISEYNSLYSSLACDDFFIEKQKKADTEAAKKVSDEAFEKQKEVFKIASGDDLDTKEIITYSAVGLAAIVFMFVLFKKTKI
jgi:hypothetical protein